jgi:hypothetical protein
MTVMLVREGFSWIRGTLTLIAQAEGQLNS